MITRIYTRDYVAIDYDSSVPCAMATYTGYLFPEEFKEHLNFALAFMQEKIKETGRMFWMADARLSLALDEETIKWVGEDWNLRAAEAGIQHIALIVAEEVWAVIAVEDYSDKAQAYGLTVKYFKDVDAAKTWFCEMSQA